MEINLVRHGESLANIGESEELDTVLTRRGGLQAVATGARLARDTAVDGPFRMAYVSPFRRTLMTYSLISVAIDTPSKVYHELSEFFADDDPRYHTFVGMNADEIRSVYPAIEVDEEFARMPTWWPGRLESRQAVYDRAVRARNYFVQRYGHADRIIVVSHAETIGRLVEAFLMHPPADRPPWTDNCGIYRLRSDSPDAPAELLLSNDVSHLRADGLTDAP